jgi:hypothetical protein
MGSFKELCAALYSQLCSVVARKKSLVNTIIGLSVELSSLRVFSKNKKIFPNYNEKLRRCTDKAEYRREREKRRICC